MKRKIFLDLTIEVQFVDNDTDTILNLQFIG